ncbi:PrsW family glutamic-type intramembrane protease [Brunnivagina elsteri]|uniref:PrsW family intramembrane metalloprotease n=1 Tax=Brunnivagina elsteri CCALA 953 TaxID=987040 RepID=A0A2A2TML7_9CYAN|nr:PrsW family glutamic-type intramembrane protease [Calothrix elsteri]PAX59647.1 PrsW family intramembrane metalloprotease [Calothrix elsteri CCALA 953]
MPDLILLITAVAPALLLLAFYHWRLNFSASRSLLRSTLFFFSFFILGMISGLLALGLQLIFESLIGQIPGWQRFTRTLIGASIRQLFAIAPIEEACKFAVTFIPVYFLQSRYNLRIRAIFLCAIAVCLGFSAQENVVYVFHNSELLFERVIGTAFHTLFSTPWVYALSKYTTIINSHQQDYRKYLFFAGANSVICHALVNILSTAGEYARNLQFLSYGLFPFLLWMFWRFELCLNLVQNKSVTPLISGLTRQHRYWQRGLVLFILILGGNAILGMFVLVEKVSPLLSRNILDAEIFWYILSRISVNLIFGILAVAIYLYLRNS